jgi:hypothetical protein
MADDFRARFFHADDIERSQNERQHALERETPFELELRARRKDGQYRWLLIRYNPLQDEEGRIIRWYATGTDIDDRKRAEERTQKENLALREEIDQSSMFEEIVGSSDVIRNILTRKSPKCAVRFHGTRAGWRPGRQGADRTGHSQALEAVFPGVYYRQLRGDSRVAHCL